MRYLAYYANYKEKKNSGGIIGFHRFIYFTYEKRHLYSNILLFLFYSYLTFKEEKSLLNWLEAERRDYGSSILHRIRLN